MKHSFSADFFLGTSTASAQIETAYKHQWKGVVSKDGALFDRTIEHEKNRTIDIEYIAMTSEVYRMSVDWSRLQSAPNAFFEEIYTAECKAWMQDLQTKNVKIMLVCHHFAEPDWFGAIGGWASPKTIPFFLNYVDQLIENFGAYVSYWNTINEPNVYAFNSYLMGEFPPFKKSIFATIKVLNNLAAAHHQAFNLIKNKCDTPVGLSYNTAVFTLHNWLGAIPAALSHFFFNVWAADKFCKTGDFCGISYYAKIRFNPLPITEINQPGKLSKLNLPHDDMWEYHPQGLTYMLDFFYKKYGKPMIITESGLCSNNDELRIKAIDDYLLAVQAAIDKGTPVLGYTHWSTFDNHEWSLGNTYRFGLVHVDFETMQRTAKPSAHHYRALIDSKNKNR